MQKLSGCERKATPFETLDKCLVDISNISREIKAISSNITNDMFGQKPKPGPEICGKDSAYEGSMGSFVNLAENSLDTLREALDILGELRIKTDLGHPVSTEPTLKEDKRTW